MKNRRVIEERLLAYPTTVRWSAEDGCFIGTVEGLIGDCCHGPEPEAVFAEAQEIAKECIAAALRDGDELPNPEPQRHHDPEPQQIRRNLGMSQISFARALGISSKTLHKWEQKTSRPSGAARTLLKIAAIEPAAVRRAINSD